MTLQLSEKEDVCISAMQPCRRRCLYTSMTELERSGYGSSRLSRCHSFGFRHQHCSGTAACFCHAYSSLPIHAACQVDRPCKLCAYAQVKATEHQRQQYDHAGRPTYMDSAADTGRAAESGPRLHPRAWPGCCNTTAPPSHSCWRVVR